MVSLAIHIVAFVVIAGAAIFCLVLLIWLFARLFDRLGIYKQKRQHESNEALLEERQRLWKQSPEYKQIYEQTVDWRDFDKIAVPPNNWHTTSGRRR